MVRQKLKSKTAKQRIKIYINDLDFIDLIGVADYIVNRLHNQIEKNITKFYKIKGKGFLVIKNNQTIILDLNRIKNICYEINFKITKINYLYTKYKNTLNFIHFQNSCSKKFK